MTGVGVVRRVAIGNFGDNGTGLPSPKRSPGFAQAGGLLGKAARSTVPVVKTATIALAAILAVLVGALIYYDGSLHPCDMVRHDLLRRYGPTADMTSYDLTRPSMETRRCLDSWMHLNFGSGGTT